MRSNLVYSLNEDLIGPVGSLINLTVFTWVDNFAETLKKDVLMNIFM